MPDRELEEILEIPEMKEFLRELDLAQKKFYRHRLDLFKAVDKTQLQLLKRVILDLGLPIEIKTEFGTLKCFYKPQESYLREFVKNLHILREPEKNLPDVQKISKSELLEHASNLTIVFYDYLLQNLKDEIETAIKNAWKLSRVDLGIKLGKTEKSPSIVTEIINKITKENRQKYTQKYQIGRGLSLKAKKSIWQDAFFVEFYLTVESFPTEVIKGKEKSIWEYAYFIIDNLGESHLKELENDSRFSDAPPGLLRQAVKIWVDCSINSRKIDPKFKPRNLLFVHALHKLGVKKEYKPSSLQTYWEKGKNLIDGSDFKS